MPFFTHFALITLNTLVIYTQSPAMATDQACSYCKSLFATDRTTQRFATNQLMCTSCATLVMQLDIEQLALSQKGTGSVLCEPLVNP